MFKNISNKDNKEYEKWREETQPKVQAAMEELGVEVRAVIMTSSEGIIPKILLLPKVKVKEIVE